MYRVGAQPVFVIANWINNWIQSLVEWGVDRNENHRRNVILAKTDSGMSP